MTSDGRQRGDAASAAFVSLGRYRVRDFDVPVELYQVVGRGLDADFPPLRVLPADGHNLVPPSTSFVGRDAELASSPASSPTTAS